MKKRPFVLLEILIGIFLLGVVAVPLLKNPIVIYRQEITALEEMEGERLADLTFIEMKEKLFNNEIPWKQLPAPGEDRVFTLSALDLQIPGFSSKKIKRKVVLRCDSDKEKREDGSLHRLLKVKISFTPSLRVNRKNKENKKFYSYNVVVRKLLQEK